MNNRKSLWIAPALFLLLIGGVSTALVTPMVPTVNKTLDPEARVDVRAKEETRLFRKENKAYKTQLKMLAKQYKKTAMVVKRQGGDPTPLLKAAAHFKQKAVYKDKQSIRTE